MWVRDWMVSPAECLAPGGTAAAALERLAGRGASHLPVMAGEQYLGLASAEGIVRLAAQRLAREGLPALADFLAATPLRDLLGPPSPPLAPFATLEEAAARMGTGEEDALPVMEEGRLVGILTWRELLAGYAALLGRGPGTVQIALDLPDQPGALIRVLQTIRRFRGRTVSLVTSAAASREGRRQVFLRARNLDPARLPELKRELFQLGGLYFLRDAADNSPGLPATPRPTREEA